MTNVELSLVESLTLAAREIEHSFPGRAKTVREAAARIEALKKPSPARIEAIQQLIFDGVSKCRDYWEIAEEIAALSALSPARMRDEKRD